MAWALMGVPVPFGAFSMDKRLKVLGVTTRDAVATTPFVPVTV
jgi:hypothetical protein